MQPRRYAFGMADDTTHRDSARATLSEFLSTFIFVFAGEGSVLALDKMYKGRKVWGASGLVVVALAQALSFFAAVASSMNVSGGHVNPAVTFGALVGGRISVLRAFYYWASQLLAAFFATVFLRAATSMRPIGFAVAAGVGNWNAVLMEIVMTFGLVYTVYATAIDNKKGSMGTIAPLAIAFILFRDALQLLEKQMLYQYYKFSIKAEQTSL
ncbi:hypothetical protein LguiB_007428 [Lonicera macranthoides]